MCLKIVVLCASLPVGCRFMAVSPNPALRTFHPDHVTVTISLLDDCRAIPFRFNVKSRTCLDTTDLWVLVAAVNEHGIQK